MSILCTLQNINLAFGNNILFKNAKLTISHQDRIGLIGLNGAGKTSLFKILQEAISPDISSPPFMFDKATGKDDEKLKFSVFFVPQELPLEENDNITIKDYLFRFYPTLSQYNSQLQKINHELESINDQCPMGNLIEKQKELLEKIEFIDGWNTIQNYNSYLKYFGHYDDNKPVRNLSGGEQKKILLALGLSANSNLILWDEPTNHLDLETIKLFEEELSGTDRAFMLVSHDRYLLSKLTKKIIHIKNGMIETFEGSYGDYLKFLSQVEESRKKLVEKLDNHLRRETAWMRQGIKARGCRSKKRVENFHDLRATISKIKANAKQELVLGLKGSARKTKKLIEFKNFTAGINQDPLFDNISFTINKGDKIGLLGANGIGKTTLVRYISDLLPLNNTNPSDSFSNCEKVFRAPNLKIQYFSQKRSELNPDETPFKLLGEGIDFVSLPDGRQIHVTSYFESFLFPKENIHRPLHTFSGGERNRLQLAFNLKHAGDLWIFDEPTNDLDLETLQLLETKLTEFKGSLILISHDRAFLSNVTNKIWLIQNKSIEKFEGGYSQVEPYLDALTFENLLLADTEETKTSIEPEKPPPSLNTKGTKERLTNKQKERVKVIDQDIEKAEEELAHIEKEVKEFNFSQMSEEKSKKFEEISARQKELEETLLELYDEQEKLSGN